MKRGLFILTALCLLFGTAWSATIYVPDNYNLIQDAIVMAASGDTVVVRPGTYVENINFLGKDITVMSEKGPAVTAIDGGGADTVVRFENAEGPASILDGFTIRNGHSTPYLVGGGIHCSTSSSTIVNNVITDNISDYEGGGILCIGVCGTIVSNNVIKHNQAHDGAGVSCMWGADIQLVNNEITRNSAANASGIHCNGASPLIAGNLIHRNDSSNYDGGGIGLGDSDAIVADNVIHSNTCPDQGGGIYADYGSAPIITNNTIYGNSANEGGGLYFRNNQGLVVIANTILWSNYAGIGKEIYAGTPAEPADVDISYSDVDGGQASVFVDPGSTLNWGAGMITTPPLFVDEANLDFHLNLYSPCLNTGDSAAPGIQATDFEGDPRTVLSAVDIGADEFYYHLYSVGSVTPGSPLDIKIIGKPGVPALLGLGAGLRMPPLQTPYGLLHLVTPLLKTFGLGQIPADGVLVFSTTIPSGWVAGDQHHFQAIAGLWGVPGSVLTNPMTLTVE